jgi:tetratricopeptide (TPR) repeat protein
MSCSQGKHSSDGAPASDSVQMLLQSYQRQVITFPDSAFNSAERALQLSQHGVEGQTMFDIFFALGVASEKLGQYDVAISYFLIALDYSKKVALSNLAIAYNYVGQTALRLGRDDMAMEYFPKALKIRMGQNDREGQASSYRNIGSVYQSERKFKEAEEHYIRSLQLYKQLDNIEGQASCYNNLGGLQLELTEYDKALEYYLKSEQYCQKVDNPELLLLVIYNQGLLNEDLGKFELARREYFKALRIAQTQSHHRAMAEAYYSIGRSMQKSEKADSAIFYLSKAVETARQLNLEEIETWALKSRAESFTTLRRYAEATDDYNLAFVMSDKLNKKNQTKAKLFTQRHMQYEVDARQEQQIQHNRVLRNYIVALISIILLMNVFIFILFRNNIKKNKVGGKLAKPLSKTGVAFTFLVALFMSCSQGKFSNDGVPASDSIQILLQNYHQQVKTFPDSAFISAERALRLSQQGVDGQTAIFDIFFALGVASEKLGQYDMSIQYFMKALDFEKADFSRLATLYNYIGQTALQLGKGDMAMEYFPKALKIRVDQEDEERQASSYRNIGTVYQSERKFKEAEEHYQRSLLLYIKLNNIEGQANCYNNLGGLLAELGEYDQALEYYQTSELYCIDINDPELLLMVVYNIGLLKEDFGEYEEARSVYFKTLSIAKTQSLHRAMAEAYCSIGRSMQDLGKADSAVFYYTKGIETARQFNLDELENWALRSRAESYTKLRRYKDANDDYETAFFMSEDLNRENQNKARLFTQKYMQYESDVRQELQMQRTRALQKYIGALVGLVLMINVVIIILYRNNQQKKKANAKLAEQRDEITKQHNEIKKQHRDMSESIAAESLKKKAVLPPKEYMDQVLPDHFMFFRPHNGMVSGDFYWMAHKGAYKVVAVADCTGHGVSGAIVSMLGISSLNKIVSTMETPHSDLILNQLRDTIILLLNPEGAASNTRNGMDIALVVIDTANRKIEYSGAKNSLYWIHNGELIEKKANKMSVGADERQHNPFTSELLDYSEGDMIYMTSDGYIDQFDNADQEKFKSKRFTALLSSIAEKPLPEQFRIIEKTHVDWRGSTKQTDDVLVLGIKF